jgi:hypothetical protein
MSLPTQDVQPHAHARQRRRRPAQARRARERRPAPPAAPALQQARAALGLPAALVTESAGRRGSQHTLLGQIVGGRGPPRCGGRPHTALGRGRGWEKTLPSRVLGALPKRSWRQRLRRWGLAGLVPWWRHAASTREATRRRWPWTWGADDAVCTK